MGDEDSVSGAEFGRWRADFQAYQTRLDTRLDKGFGDLNERLDTLNGRTRSLESGVAVLGSRVTKVETSGCGQLLQHQQVISAMAVTPDAKPIHRDPRAYAGAGIGTLIATVLYELIKHLVPGLGV